MNKTRRVLLLAAAPALLLGGSTYGLLRWQISEPEDFVLDVLQRHLPDLQVDAAHRVTFARDYVQHREDYRRQLRAFAAGAGPFRLALKTGLLSKDHGFRRTQDQIVALFLLSTDFFQNGASLERPVTYLGFYDPLSAICRNPLMRFA